AEQQRLHKEAVEAREQELRREFAEGEAEREAKIRARLEEKTATDIAYLEEQVEAQKVDLKESRERQVELLRQKDTLDRQKANLEIEYERKREADRKKIAAEERESANEQHRMALEDVPPVVEFRRRSGVMVRR
ncbi:MAG TPA: hypothetical protein VN960_01685, partial [Gaiellaceae bacterium]|nr:hypothetical protein [Gaiellaceae bacterium]